MEDDNLLEFRRYLLAAWILKIRLLSSRRRLWDEETSLIHIEESALQMRKCCEAISHLCLIAAGIDGLKVTKSHRKNYQTGLLFKELDKLGVLRFPSIARLTQKQVYEQNSSWEMNISFYEKADFERVGRIHSQLGQLLHDIPLLNNSNKFTAQELVRMLNLLRGDHQWLWNRFWHHAFYIRNKLLFINLGDVTRASPPVYVKEEGLFDGEIVLDFDPELVADFFGEIEWSRYV